MCVPVKLKYLRQNREIIKSVEPLQPGVLAGRL